MRSLFPPPQNSVTSPLHWLAKQAGSPFAARVDPAPGAALLQKHWIAYCNQSARALFSTSQEKIHHTSTPKYDMPWPKQIPAQTSTVIGETLEGPTGRACPLTLSV